jgi:hypothetical protein
MNEKKTTKKKCISGESDNESVFTVLQFPFLTNKCNSKHTYLGL